ncbi:MAG: molybdopterin-dependent oxidoreductase [Gammaproteobacteria bacterium]|nr:molybdopterin-dependent oxidoreductase [Gammaproteobacteria bacterium]
MVDYSSLPLTASHWGTYRVETRDGQVKALHGFEKDPDVSPIGSGIIDVLDGPTRITRPAIRKSWLDQGPGAANECRGKDPFVEVNWEEAEQIVADELTRIIQTHGNNAIYAGSYGWASAGRFHHAQSQIHRFLNCIGGYVRSVDTYSFAAGEVLLPHIIGNLYVMLTHATSWPSIIDHSDLLIAFGGIPLKNGQINAGGLGRHTQKENLKRALDSGLEIVNISPVQSDLGNDSRIKWLAPRPNTDTALLLGIAHTLFHENRVNQKFIAEYTIGYERFVEYLNGKHDGTVKNAKWASEICGLSENKIVNLAREMSNGRTMISLSWSLTRQDHGEQPFWAGVAVASMLGQIGQSGGGIGFGYSATNSVGDHGSRVPGASLPQGKNPVTDFIPVARFVDMLMYPGGQYDYNGQTLTYPDIHLVYWAGGNPFHHHQDINRMLGAWQKPDTIIVNEWCWNSMAKHSDIVLPCTTTLERNDIALSPRDPFAVHMQKVVDPPGLARNDFDIFSAIARKMRIEEAFTGSRSEEEWLQLIYHQTQENAKSRGFDIPDYHDFKSTGWTLYPSPDEPTVLFKSFRDDPVNNPLKTESGKIELFCPVIDRLGYADCPGHPVWLEPFEWLGNANEDSLHLLSNQPATKLHSQLDHGQYSRSKKVGGREPVAINSREASRRSLKPKDIVRVYNQRGACLAGLVIDDGIRDRVALMSTGAWFDPHEPGVVNSLCKHGNPNVLTPDKGTSSLGQGPIANSCLVMIEKFEGTAPPVTAFDPPDFCD